MTNLWLLHHALATVYKNGHFSSKQRLTQYLESRLMSFLPIDLPGAAITHRHVLFDRIASSW